MRVFSGSSCFCDVGKPTGEFDIHGEELFTGDIVQLWHVNYQGTDYEEWMPSSGLTAIVANQYQTYSTFDGKEHRLIDNEAKPFTMGIANCGVQNAEWKVSLVKSHRNIILNESIISYGINYK